jgi:hypothetical protein
MWPFGQQNSIFVLKYLMFIFENFEKIIQRLSKFAVYGIRLDATALFIFHRSSKFAVYGIRLDATALFLYYSNYRFRLYVDSML